MKKSLFLLILIVIFLSGCSLSGIVSDSGSVGTLISPDEDYKKAKSSESWVTDRGKLYNSGFLELCDTVYLAVGKGNDTDNSNHTWSEINTTSLKDQGSKPYTCEAVLQLGDSIGPVETAFGYGELAANATVRLHGSNSSEKAQKSYRINIKDGKDTIDGIRHINLIKSLSDPYRFANALCYSLLKDIPGQFSVRQKIVHLYVKDTDLGQDTPYADYGLYTLVEPVNKTYFSNRNLDNGGNIYKAVNFDFSRHEKEIKLSGDSGYSEDEFEKLLEINGSTDHTTLIEMLEAVNNEDLSIGDVIKKYFDEDNLYYYLAFQILTDNYDSALINYYLYSPSGSDKYYFISWDMDGAFNKAYKKFRNPQWDEGWQKGVFPFCQNKLFRRIYSDAETREILDNAVRLVYGQYLGEDSVKSLAGKYSSKFAADLYQLPDRTLAKVPEEDYLELTKEIYPEIKQNYEDYFDGVYTPQPFHILSPEKSGAGIMLRWEKADCLSSVTYHVTVDDSWDFKTPLKTGDVSDATEVLISSLSKGQYFVKVEAESSEGKKQISFDNYYSELNGTIHGLLCFYVDGDGNVIPSYFDLEY